MNKIKIGILSPSNIAYNRFLPSLQKSINFEYIGLAVANCEEWKNEFETVSEEILKADLDKAKRFTDKFGGEIYQSYTDMIHDTNIDAVYIPLPPALHYEWAKKALIAGKHVLVEKPSTTKQDDTNELIELAKKKDLAFHENYMFVFHKQVNIIKSMISSEEFGQIRGYKMSFGFPRRDKSDFRYNASLGGGALLDCGGYPMKLASVLLGETAEVMYSKLNYTDEFEVNLFGTVVMENGNGITAQISFGMDNAYQCQLEAWGSKQTIIAPRIFTAGSDVEPPIIIRSSTDEEKIVLDTDDQFLHSIDHFYDCIKNENARVQNYKTISKQSELVEYVMKKGEEEKCR